MSEHIVTRRHFLDLLLKLSTVLPTSVLLAAPVEKARRSVSVRALKPYLDTLLPEDSTPSATQLGVDRNLITQARRNRNFLRLIALGCAWLDEQAGDFGAEEFAALAEEGREAVITRAEQSKLRSLPRQFFERTRREAFSHYYAQPGVWEGLGYEGPPQPLGFPDHNQPPKGAGA